MSEQNNYGTATKRVVFQDTDKRHAELKIRLHYDGLTSSDFFRGMITGYLKKDDLIMKFVEKLKENKKIPKIRRKAVIKMDDKSKDTVKKFALAPDDIESIFDLIEKEHPEL